MACLRLRWGVSASDTASLSTVWPWMDIWLELLTLKSTTARGCLVQGIGLDNFACWAEKHLNCTILTPTLYISCICTLGQNAVFAGPG